MAGWPSCAKRPTSISGWMTEPRLPPLAVSCGEPAGIGPDLLLQLAAGESLPPLVALSSATLLRDRATQLGLNIRLREWTGEMPVHEPGTLWIRDLPLDGPVTPGQAEPVHARAVLEALRQGVEGCRSGEFSGLVTAPVNKAIINAAGIPFSGHTEFLAEHCDNARPVMMLACPGLRVALATTHLPLRAVPDAISGEHLEQTLRILDGDLRARFGIPTPRILVCGLNPHAGEGGHLGREEIEVITPALERLRAQGLDLVGPLPADTLFTPHRLEGADAVLAMYHDQGLPVLKYAGFGHAVNITLGLPILRTSVDHGTALDLAGTGKADPGSLREAIRMAAELAGRTPA